MFCPSM